MKVVLCRQGFTAEYVEQIRKEIPAEFRITETTLPDSHAVRSPQYLLVLFGSAQTQKTQAVKIRFCHANNNSFIVPVKDLKEFLSKALRPTSQT
jgi:hypothetical protein